MDYTAIATNVLNLLTEYGMSMTLTRQTSGTFDAETGQYGSAVDTDYAAIGLVQAPNAKGEGDRYFPGTTIAAGDRYVILASSGMTVDPAAGDTLTIGGTAYSIVASMPVSPAGTDLLYRLLVRK